MAEANEAQFASVLDKYGFKMGVYGMPDPPTPTYEELAAQVKRWEEHEIRKAVCCDENEQAVVRLTARVAELEVDLTEAVRERARMRAVSMEAGISLDNGRTLTCTKCGEANRSITDTDRIAELEDTIDLERARREVSWMHNYGGDASFARAIIAKIEERRGIGWKGARE